MTLAACQAFYGMLVAVAGPRLLSRLTAAGTAPRLGVAVWILAVGSVLASWVGAAVATVWSVFEWSGRVADLLRSCLVVLRPVDPYEPVAGALVIGLAGLAVTWLGWLSWRVGSHWVRAHHHGLRHARAVRLAGAENPQLGTGTVVVDIPEVAAYCVASASRTVVVTRGALEALQPQELDAVLAHERAHLAGRHHLLLILLGALRRALPGVLLFHLAHIEVGRLLEMCADDAAARRHGTLPLVAALVAMTGWPAPRGALGAADRSAFARTLRLAEPPSPARHAAHRAALGGTAATLVLAPSVVLGAMALSTCPLIVL